MNDASSSVSATNPSQISHEEISRQAQELWEKYGRPSGRDEEIWLEAERTLRAQQAPRSSVAPAPGPAAPATAPATPPPAAGLRPGRSTAAARMPGSRSRAKG